MEYSCLKTLASKHKSTVSKIVSKYRHGKTWSIPYMTRTGAKRVRIVKTADCKQGPVNDTIPRNSLFPRRRTVQKRLNSRVCELCDDKRAEAYEVHHVGNLKKLYLYGWKAFKN
jgi:hypothetical protein